MMQMAGADRSVRGPQTEAEEGVWIEIIRHMESVYAQLAQAQDALERHAVELAEAKELADNIIRSMSDGLIVLDAAGRIKLVNESVDRLFGFPGVELEGEPLSLLVPDVERERWEWRNLRRAVERQGGLPEAEATWRTRSGEPIAVGVSGAALRDRLGDLMGAVLVVRDLRETKRRIAEARAATEAARMKAAELERANAELKRLQAELVQAAKMSSLGRLAAGVAHEHNNPLGSILLYSDLVLEDTPEDDPRRPNLLKIAEQAARCRQIVRGLLDFARPTESTTGPVDVNAALKQALSVLEGQEMFHNVVVEWNLSPSPPTLTADASQPRQAFTNICLNAVEAMDGRGTLTIATEPDPDGTSVVVSITDTGCGIPEADRERLFEPFFTTKEDGTGLGLAITYGIIERHGGEIAVQSEPGKGTTFRLTIRSMEESGSGAH